MPVDSTTMKSHVGLNPTYFGDMKERKAIQNMNRDNEKGFGIRQIRVPKQPNKYVPHYGAKEAAKHAQRGSL
jgi:hypothetical protein